ncbi:hypothetical protein, partial [Streptomyces antimicrobicus]
MSELAACIRGLTAQLDPGAGWYGAFLRRDPDGIRACLEGTAVPPWDVLESLLQDLAAVRGPDAAAEHARRAARLRWAAVAGYDRRAGGAAELHALLAVAAAERAAAETSVRALTARLAAGHRPAHGPGPDLALLTRELSWARDDLARADSRHADLCARLTALSRTPATPDPPSPATSSGPSTPSGPATSSGPAIPSAPAMSVPAPSGPPTLHASRGARVLTLVRHRPAPPPPPAPSAHGGTAAFVAALAELRARGRSGEAHGLICEAARWPAGRLPGLARELERQGRGAEWATLLWEVGGLP